jgi:hypothetical protein
MLQASTFHDYIWPDRFGIQFASALSAGASQENQVAHVKLL